MQANGQVLTFFYHYGHFTMKLTHLVFNVPTCSAEAESHRDYQYEGQVR